MKKLYFLLLLFTSFAFAQPPINNPVPYHLCDLGNDGLEVFDLTVMNDQILGSLSPSLYSVTYYTTLTDAQFAINAVTNPTTFSSQTATMYVRVEENANTTNYSMTSFDLVVDSLPTAIILGTTASICYGTSISMVFQASGGVGPYHIMYAVDGGPIQTIATGAGGQANIVFPDLAVGMHTLTLTLVTSDATGCYQSLSETATIVVYPPITAGLPVDFYIEDTPYDGVAAFDFTPNVALLANGQTDVSVLFFETLTDAYNNTNPIINPPYFNIVSPTQVIYARVQNELTGCFTVTNFTINVVDPTAVVNIPDANFKAKLTGTNCADFNNDGVFDGDVDTNNDGQIQFSEALAVKKLQVNNTSLPSPTAISSLTGVEAFTNLVDLNCMLNTIETFNYAIPSLQTLTIGNNSLTSLNLSGIPNLITLDCAQNNLTVLDLTAVPNLVSLGCDYNQITALTISGLSHLTSLSARYNNLTSLDLSQSSGLIGLQVDGNNFPLNVSNLVNLQSLGCAYMGLTDIDLTQNVNLTILSMNGNNFTELTLPHLPLLTTLFCGESTTMTSLNLNGLTSLLTFLVVNNPNLIKLFMKNGMPLFSNFSLAENFNLEFVCVDDFNITGISTHLALAGITGVNVCSYCSFTPGGDYNTIFGHLTFDADNNGCDINDMAQPNIRVDIHDGVDTGASFNSSNGNYTFFTQGGTFTLTPNVENPTWFTITPSAETVFFSDNQNHTVTKDFCISPNGSHQDLEIVLAPLTTARPGFDVVYQLTYKNKGNTILPALSAGITLVYDNRIVYLSSSQPVSATGVNSVSFDYPTLLPFASGTIQVTFHVNAPTENPAVNIGDVLQLTATISPNNNDENVDDNTFQFHQTVVGSFDPNDITCLEGSVVAPTEIGKYLHYIINFENTGTYQAENIVIKDEIDAAQYDLNSLQVLSSSASITTRLTNNIAEFIFKNINLDSGGHGNILLKIKSKNTLVQGDMVSKKANIYFDYNFPVATNNADTVFQSLNTPDFPKDATISVYPNPVKDTLVVTSQFAVKSVELYDVQGRLLQTQLTKETRTVLDMSAQIKGVYFIKITTEKGIKVEKVVKE